MPADVRNRANDVRQVEPMLQQAKANLKATGVETSLRELLTDADDSSKDNVTDAESQRINPFFATGN